MALTPTSMGYSPTIPLEVEELKPSKWQSLFAKLRRPLDHSPAARDRKELKQDVEQERASQQETKVGRKVIPSLPRPPTIKRQQSEMRDRLEPVFTGPTEKRALSVGRKRQRAMSARPAARAHDMPSIASLSGYSYHGSLDSFPKLTQEQTNDRQLHGNHTSEQSNSQPFEQPVQRPAPPLSPPPDTPDEDPEEPFDEQLDEDLRRELEDRWILNLSMHFRDRSPREKFFVTYAETPNYWRRVTVSIDYRDAPPESLERDLQTLQFQRDKSARIYEAIRTSLPDIQFYDTVTNLRLETSPDDRLHVHVTEDVNEIIQYPSTNLVRHVDCKRVPESEVHFDSHMSGFVYKVKVDDKVCIKKEIPGPDSVEEFLYEINALHELIGSKNVIKFEGLVVDDDSGLVKGLLIGYAEKGPLVDMIYDDKGSLPWERRQRWANQIVNGLSEIHEAGFVQGDFTLSNIVIDENDDARIIDINRRGCPVGWEPPEIAKMIESGQRISMYIGVKSDLFQLGMVLWAIAEEEDEPERQHRPLTLDHASPVVPLWYRELTHRCLSDTPKDRLSTRDLLVYFDKSSGDSLPPFHQVPSVHGSLPRTRSHSRSRPSDTHYIDPGAAVGREDIVESGRFRRQSPDFTESSTYYERPASLGLPFDGEGSYIIPHRGRTPPVNTAHLDPPHHGLHQVNDPNFPYDPQVIPISPGTHHWNEMEIDGRNFIVNEEPEGRSPEVPGVLSAHIDGHANAPASYFTPSPFHHVDSGFDDLSTPIISSRRQFSHPGGSRLNKFEHVDSGLADMDLGLVGIGENEAFANYNAKQTPNIGGDGPEELTIEEEPCKEDEADVAQPEQGAQVNETFENEQLSNGLESGFFDTTTIRNAIKGGPDTRGLVTGEETGGDINTTNMSAHAATTNSAVGGSDMKNLQHFPATDSSDLQQLNHAYKEASATQYGEPSSTRQQ